MNIFSVAIILVILLYGVLGFKRGVIRTGVSLLGTIAILIISYVLKDFIADFMIKHLPFFNYGGLFEGITSINILVYKMIAFIVVFVVLYCILNILITLSGLVEKILKITIILAIPSKIMGGILGIIEGLIVTFLVTFALFHLAPTQKYIMDSPVAIILLERSPFISSLTTSTTLALEDINDIVSNLKENSNRSEANYQILHRMIYWKVITVEEAQWLIDNNKIILDNDVELNK